MVLPAGLTKRDFASALEEFADAVGRQFVFTSDEHINTYRDEFGPLRGTPQDPVPAAAIAPGSVEEVQKIVRIANQYRVPLWVISCGKNWGYGGPAPRVAGSVVVDLKRMNRILEVNEQHAYALVEPGVSYFDLYRHIQERELKLWIDGPVGGWGSIVANTVERGVGQSILGDFYNFQCGMEVVLPDGELMRTGMGAVPGSQTWQQYKWGFGPHVDGLFSHSNIGIVTKIGTWLAPEPPVFLSCQVSVPRFEDIVPLIDITRPLRQKNLLVNSAVFPPRLGRAQDPDDLGGWYNKIGIYGEDKVVDLQWQHVQDAYAAIPGVEFKVRRFTAPYDAGEMDAFGRTLAGIPGVGGYGYRGVFCSPILPFTGEAIWNMIHSFDRIYQEYGLRYFGEAIHIHQARALVAPATVPISLDDPKVNETAVALVRRLIAESTRQGWGVYRITTAFMDEAMAAFSFNNGALLRFHETLKDALDPNGILAPGKNGIWPSTHRGRRA